MKRFATVIVSVLSMVFVFGTTTNAQLSGTKTIPGDYATIAAAVTALNSQGVGPGGVTFNVAAGHTESVTAPILITATGTVANPIAFQKSGAGANPAVTRTDAGTLATTTLGGQGDAVILIEGSDYLTFDGINVTASDQGIEYGYYLRKADSTNGCKFVTIKNATITMTKGTSQYVVGIYSSNNDSTSLVSSATGITVVSVGGRHENVVLTGNTITNVFAGIVLRGFNHTTAPYDFYDQNFVVGAPAAGNTIQNFAGNVAATAYGVYMIYHNDISISYNTLNNTAGGGTGFTSIGYGIFTSTATNANVTINNNNLSLTSASTTSTLFGISNAAGGSGTSNTVTIANNMLDGFSYPTATSGPLTPITNSASAVTVNILNNTVSNVSLSASGLTGSGTLYAIYNTGSATNVNVLGNTVRNISRTGTTGGTTIGIYVSSGTNQTVKHNLVDSLSIDGTGTTSTMYGIQTSTGTIVVDSNIVRNLTVIKTTGTSALYGIYNISSPTNENFNYNQIYNITHNGTGTTYGIYTFTTTGVRTVSNNLVYNISTGGTTVAGITQSSSSPTIFNNKIYNIQSNSTGAPTVSGISLTSLGTSGSANIYNNLIGDLKAPNASTSAATAPSIRGINITAGTATSTINLSYNTVYLNAASTGTNFGTAALFVTTSTTATTAALTLRNNIFVNLSTPAGIGLTSAYQRSSTALDNYASASNNNLFYAGTPGPANLIFYDGTNADQTLAAFKTRVAPREATSITENPPFLSTIGSSPNFLHISTTVPTQIESGGQPVAGITVDYDGDTRNATTPDIGADEFAGLGVDLTGPSISYTPLPHTSSTAARTLAATITDPSGVPTAGIGLPVLYWRINSGAYAAAQGTYVSGGNYSFTFGAGVSLGDTISYFIAAQDSASPPNVSVQPSAGAGGLTANPPAASTPPTNPSSYIITQPPLSGDYTVGTSVFNRITGRNLTFQKSVRKVMKEVVVEVPSSNRSVAKGQENDAAATSVSHEVTGVTQLMEVEEVSWIPMENGKVYEGNLYAKRFEHPELNWPAGIQGVYPTITAAVADLNLRGTSGHTRFLLTDTAYATETFPIVVNVVNEVGPPTDTSSVTIKPDSGVTTRIYGAAPSSRLFAIRNSNVHLDGSNSPGGTTRNMTIENTSATSPSVILIGSTGTTPIRNCSVKNCIVINGAQTATAIIVSDGATPGAAGWFNDITIQNNSIQKSYIGNYNIAVVAPGNGSGLLVTGNDVNTAGTNSIRLVGLYVQGVDSATVSNNNIGNIANTLDASNITGIWFATGTRNSIISNNTISTLSGTSSGPRGIVVSSGTTNANVSVTDNIVSSITTSSTGIPYGIYTFSAMSGVTIEKNKVSDLLNTNTGGYGARGIHVNTGLATSNITLKNNFVWNVRATSDNATTYWGIGIGIEGATGGVNVYYNSVHLYDTLAGYAFGSGTIHTAFGVLTSTATALDVRNNIFVNSFDNTNQTIDKSYAIRSNAPNTAFTNIDNNDYYVAGPAGVLGYLGTDILTLADWRTATGRDSNSVSADPMFVSPTNLHIISYLPNVLDSAGTPIAGITTDIDGDVRNATYPDIGADEFTVIQLPPPVVLNVTRSTRVPLAGDSVVVTCTITDSVGINTANLIYNVNDTVNSTPMTLTSGTPQNGTWRGVVPGSANQNGRRIELQIQANSISGASTTTPKAAARSYYAGISPLSLTGLRRLHPDGRIRDSLYYARVTGTVNGPNFQTTNLGYHFQDAVGGIQLFSFGITRPPLNRGDSIIVVGRIAQFRGLTEIIPDTQTTDIQVVDTARTVTPIELTVPAFNANPEMYESRLVRMTSLRRRDATPPWPGIGTSANIVVYQNTVTDTIIMRIDSDTEIPGSPEPSYPVNVTGVITQFSSATSVYNNGYQTQPRYLTDLVSAPAPLSGTYTVGAGGNFPTLDSAFTALGSRGVSGPVTFSLIDSLYRPTGQMTERDLQALSAPRTLDMVTDDGQVVTINPLQAQANEGGDESLDIVGINLTGPIPGASATNRVTVRPANNVRARIVGTGPATFNFRNVSYVTFDGVGTTGPTQLAIENTAANGIAIALLGNSDNNIVQNLTLRTQYASGIGVYIDTASAAVGDSNAILNNNIPVSYFGVYIRGGNVVARGNQVMSNVFGADSLGALGVYNQQVNGSIIANNRIQNVKDAVAAGGNIAGIWIATRQLNLRVYNNVISGVLNRPGATAAVFASGIYCFGTSTDTTRSKFYNNMVYGLDNPTSSASGTIRGIYLSTSRFDTAAYNSVHLTGNDMAGITSGALYLSSAANTVTLLNNIAVNSRVSTGTGRAMAFYLIAAPTGLTTNYNDLYVPTQPGSHVAAIGTTNYTTLAQWQTTGRDSQSVNVMPAFQAPDLHINPSIPSPIDGGGRPIASITTDIDGQTRHPLRPDIGADEFQAASFFDNFETYTVGQQLACQNPVDWTTWSLSPCNTTEDPLISSAFAYSGTKSVVIVQNNDLVKRLGADTTGVYSMTFRFYIPRTKAGYFNTLAVFTPPSTFNWAMEVYFDSTGNGRLFAGSATPFPFTFTRDAWQLARVVVDLTRDSAKFYINATLVRTWRWTAGSSGGGSPRRLAANDFFGATAWDQMYVDDYDFRPDTWTGVDETPTVLPETFALMQNYPNPFNPTTTIRYALPRDARVTVSVYNILGQLVTELVNDVQNAGYHNIVWNGRNQSGTQVATGVYLYRIEARPTDGSAPFVSTKKMVLIK